MYAHGVAKVTKGVSILDFILVHKTFRFIDIKALNFSLTEVYLCKGPQLLFALHVRAFNHRFGINE